MHSGGKRASLSFLSFICALIIGMCLGTVPADSFLERGCFSSAGEGIPSRACSIQSRGNAAPGPQIFEHRSFGQCEAALRLRHTTRRHSVRTGRGFSSIPLTTDIIFLSMPRGASYCTRGLFQESASHTIIISYIHQQDGQKPLSPFYSCS